MGKPAPSQTIKMIESSGLRPVSVFIDDIDNTGHLAVVDFAKGRIKNQTVIHADFKQFSPCEIIGPAFLT